jgi:serine/threonine protein kinase
LARLKHPNIIPVRLFFEETGAAYVEFPLYDCDMEAWLEKRSPTYPDVHAASHDILRAIEHMHRAGVVHCDIRPKNVLMKQREVTVSFFVVIVNIFSTRSRKCLDV